MLSAHAIDYMRVGSSYHAQPVFTVKLGRGDEAGFYSFGESYVPSLLLFHAHISCSGFIDTSVTTDEITYTAVDK